MTSRRQRPTQRVRAQAVVGLAALPLLLSTASISAVDTTVVPPASAGGNEPAVVEGDRPVAVGGGVVATPASVVLPRLSLGEVDPGDIPWTAVQAYHRSADILGHVQPSCELSWTLLAAVGKVASDHGRAGPSDLGDDGVVAPALVGAALDGRNGRPEVPDSDGGELDGDDRWDHAVGPMQIRPEAWALAAVDGDGDGTRSVDDLDDAALATAVYLCASGDGDLADTAVAAEALRGYGGSDRWVAQVLAVEQAYAEGSFEVGAPPTISSIGSSLDTGEGVRAASARAVERVSTVRHQASLRSSGEPAPPTRPGAPADEAPTAPVDGTPSQPVDPPPADEPTPPTEPASPVEPADPTDPPAEEPPAEEPPAEEPPAQEPTAEQPCSLPAGEPGTEAPAVSPETATGDPAESPAQSPDQTPADGSADPTTEASLAVLTGTLRLDGETFCLDVLPLDALSVAPQVELLLTLVGTTVEVTVVAGTEPLVVVAVNGVATGTTAP